MKAAVLIVAGLPLFLAACGGPSTPAPVRHGQSTVSAPQPNAAPDDPSNTPLQARIQVPAQPLQCVPFARNASGIEIYGDAWTWWGQAADSYPRGVRPREGAVVVLQVNHRKRGHVAVVRRKVDRRTIIVDHANWLNRGQIHRNTPMVDVSPNNDWSQVKVWYTPGGHLGGSTYPVRGFIYPESHMAARGNAS